MHVLVLAWEPRPLPRVPAWPRVAALAAAIAGDGRRVTVLADATTTTHVAARLAGSDVAVVTAAGAAPHLDDDDLRTTVTAGGLALQTAGAALRSETTSIHAVGWQATYGAVALAEVAAVPLVATPLRIPADDGDADDRWAADVGWWLTDDADVVAVGSRRLADRLHTHGVSRDRLVVVPLPRGARTDPDLVGIREVVVPAHATAVRRRRDAPAGPSGRDIPE